MRLVMMLIVLTDEVVRATAELISQDIIATEGI
jgi:hypothetical protein